MRSARFRARSLRTRPGSRCHPSGPGADLAAPSTADASSVARGRRGADPARGPASPDQCVLYPRRTRPCPASRGCISAASHPPPQPTHPRPHRCVSRAPRTGRSSPRLPAPGTGTPQLVLTGTAHPAQCLPEPHPAQCSPEPHPASRAQGHGSRARPHPALTRTPAPFPAPSAQRHASHGRRGRTPTRTSRTPLAPPHIPVGGPRPHRSASARPHTPTAASGTHPARHLTRRRVWMVFHVKPADGPATAQCAFHVKHDDAPHRTADAG